MKEQEVPTAEGRSVTTIHPLGKELAGEGGSAANLPSRGEALALVEGWLSGIEGNSGWGGPRIKHSDDGVSSGVPDMAAGVPEGPHDKPLQETRHEVDLVADAEAVASCARCRLGSGRLHAAYGEGVIRPMVLVVGEGPGAEEDRLGRPFVGPAGQLLDRMLASIGLSRDTNCYIANIVKCRPPGNRDPATDEREACLPWLERQISVLGPGFILALGRVAAGTLLGSEEGIGRLRGKWFERKGISLLATYHPSALLHDESLKRPAWEDLKALKFRLDDAFPPG
ncbi:MAG: uracil-DNA glycosylase [Spirochaetota bacterium]